MHNLIMKEAQPQKYPKPQKHSLRYDMTAWEIYDIIVLEAQPWEIPEPHITPDMT